ncbi:hypothetical protein [Luteibacter yeojuensis]|uniref:Uncharacterized protein n=1 Tax=Luteibacter yeojuensis TaxID=345309 RepID=A0A0F3KCY2_9GAMM|nr:hypothetical protein [Luteibacter yeojuensis]KJV29090.1 hypothetical protein VI08_16385 [Luteibacter yeojuensis]
MGSEPDAATRAWAWQERAALFTGLCMAHMVASLAVLAVQTSCFDVPCFESLFFDVPRGVAMFPLFLTPLADFPAQDATFVRSGALFAWLCANAVLAVLIYACAWLGASRGWRRWRASRGTG